MLYEVLFIYLFPQNIPTRIRVEVYEIILLAVFNPTLAELHVAHEQACHHIVHINELPMNNLK